MCVCVCALAYSGGLLRSVTASGAPGGGWAPLTPQRRPHTPMMQQPWRSGVRSVLHSFAAALRANQRSQSAGMFTHMHAPTMQLPWRSGMLAALHSFSAGSTAWPGRKHMRAHTPSCNTCSAGKGKGLQGRTVSLAFQ